MTIYGNITKTDQLQQCIFWAVTFGFTFRFYIIVPEDLQKMLIQSDFFNSILLFCNDYVKCTENRWKSRYRKWLLISTVVDFMYVNTYMHLYWKLKYKSVQNSAQLRILLRFFPLFYKKNTIFLFGILFSFFK